MTSNFKMHKSRVCLLITMFVFSFCFSQGDTSTWKAQIAFGVNSPSQKGFVNNFEAKSLNFPTINLGVQYMFSRYLGTKLDYSYNRFSNEDNAPEFKVNYSRINTQLVYDMNSHLKILPPRYGLFPHVGPGFTFIKPLAGFKENKTSYFNAMAGLEIHYGVSDTFSVFLDASYVLGFAKDFNPVSEGLGSFNGDLLTISIGVSVSLSGCYYCE